jgi:hypothetical protein
MAMILQLRGLLVLAVVMAVGLGLATPVTTAWAHPRVVSPAPVADDVAAAAPLTVPPAAAALPTPPPVAPAIALALALAVAFLLRGRAVVAAVACALVVLAVETGVHSVHHLADRPDAGDCVVALTTAQVHGIAETAPADHGPWLALPLGAVPTPTPERPGARPLRPDEGRAPPSA